MVKLTLVNPQTHQSLQQWHFPTAKTIRIGRLPDNDIVLDNFLEVSRNHLELRPVIHATKQTEWQLVSQGSNGTFVNGQLVSQTLLRDNDLIQLSVGGPLLQFQIQLSSSSVPSPQPCTHAGNSPKNMFCIYCGQPLVKKKRFIRDYQILRILGQGGMGTTYLASTRIRRGSDSPRLLVLKEMKTDMEKIAKARELFEREARILKSLSHPGIPQYYDFFVENGQKYLAMEVVHGENLEQRICTKGTVPLKQAVEWMVQLCQILDYLHSLEPPLVHRDVKPANLMVRNLDNRLMLLDFGAVKEIGTPLGTRIGAEGYSAPEQELGQPCPQSDFYAIGATLIFLLTGETPLKYYRLQGSEYRFALGEIPTLTPQLSQVIAQTCQRQWCDRYQNARELSQALTACLEE